MEPTVEQLTTKSLPRQRTSAGTPLWGLQVFLGNRTSLGGQEREAALVQLQRHKRRSSGHGSPLHHPVPLNQQRHLLDAPQHRGGVCAGGEQAHQVSKLDDFDCTEDRGRQDKNVPGQKQLLQM